MSRGEGEGGAAKCRREQCRVVQEDQIITITFIDINTIIFINIITITIIDTKC